MPGNTAVAWATGRLHSEVVRSLRSKATLILTQLTPCPAEHRSTGPPRMGMRRW